MHVYFKGVTNCKPDIIMFEDLDPVDMAFALTVIERNLFQSITETELSRLILKPSSISQGSCYNINTWLKFQQRLFKLFASCILEAVTDDERAKRIKFIIKVSCFKNI